MAVLGGRFSPIVIEQLPLLKEAKLPFIAVWSAGDAIVDNGSKPNFVFRLSLRDSLAMPFLLESARQRGLDKVGLLMTYTAWGRSNLVATEKHMRSQRLPKVVDVAWYNWQEPSLVDRYLKLRNAGAKAIVLVANDDEAALLVGRPLATEADMQAAAAELVGKGARAVLLKGGHLQGEGVSDLLQVGSAAPHWLRAPRIATANTHGTGCTLSSAIAAHLALGSPLHDAVHAAHAFVRGALQGAARVRTGAGSGALNHGHAPQAMQLRPLG